MIVLGLLLIVLAGAAVIAVSWDETAASTATASFTIFNRTFQISQLEMFFAGVATGAIFLIGLMIILAGMRRASVHRRRLRASRSEARSRVTRLEEEKRELERQLEETPEAAAAPVIDRDENTAPHPRVEAPSRPATDQLVADRHGRPGNHG